MRKLTTITLLLFSIASMAQQSQLLYQSHYLPESNFLNPAVQSPCKWFIGIPVLSSLHVNYANSGFSYNNVVQTTGEGSYRLDIDRVVDRLGRRTLLSTELQTTLFAIGHKRNDYYYTFRIAEKNNIPITLPRDIFILAWDGNTVFEGEQASARGTASYATHYREYSVGISRRLRGNDYAGVHGKLLFGKLNASLPDSDVDLHTDADNFNLTLDGSMRANISAPIIIDHTNGRINDINLDGDVNAWDIILNRQNWGLAFDAGFITRLDNRTTLSGSIVDAGFIRWRSYLHNVETEDRFTYAGVLADTNNVLESVLDSITFEVTEKPYTTWLPLKTYLGAGYRLNSRLEGRILGSAVIYRSKFTPALTFALDYNPFGHFHLLGSYSLFYGSYNNLGAGLSMGRGPMQWYILSDNIAGIIWPMSTRNVNLRFGLNLNFGCSDRGEPPPEYESIQGPCPVYDKGTDSPRRRRRRP